MLVILPIYFPSKSLCHLSLNSIAPCFSFQNSLYPSEPSFAICLCWETCQSAHSLPRGVRRLGDAFLCFKLL